MNWQPRTIALVISTVVCCVYVSMLFCEKSQSHQQSQKNHQGITKQSQLQVLEMTLGIKQPLVKKKIVKETARKIIDNSTGTNTSNNTSNNTKLDKSKPQTQLWTKTHKAKPHKTKAKAKNEHKRNDGKKSSRSASNQTTMTAQLNALSSTNSKPSLSQQKSTSAKTIAMSDAKQDAKVEAVMDKYMRQVRNFIAKHKRYPRAAKIRKQQGKVTISFVIDSQGRVHKAKVIKACRSRHINKSTKILLSKLRFKAAPNAIKVQFPKTVTLEVNYQLG